MDPLKVPTPPETKLHFLDYWRIIRIRKTVILAVFLLVVITATLVTFILPQSYASHCRIKVENDKTDIPGFSNDAIMRGGYDPYFIQNEFETIKSERVLSNVVAALGLNSTSTDFGRRWGKRFLGSDQQALRLHEAITQLRGMLDLRPERNTSFIEIYVQSPDADEAARLANAIAE